MINSELLKEAIADAKAVRATALANAKASLEEAFAPRFEAMFADKLKEEAEEEGVEMNEVEAPNQVSGKGGEAKGPATKAVSKGNPKQPKGGAGDTDFKPVKVGKGPADVANPSKKVNETTEEEEDTTMDEQFEEEGKMEEAGLTSEDLDEIIKELETEVADEEAGKPVADVPSEEPAPAPAPESGEEVDVEQPSGEVDINLGGEEGGEEEGGEGDLGMNAGGLEDGDGIENGEDPAALAAGPAPEGDDGFPQPHDSAIPEDEGIDLEELLSALNEEAEDEEKEEMDEIANNGIPKKVDGQDKSGGVKGYPKAPQDASKHQLKGKNHNISGKGNIGTGAVGGKPMEEVTKYRTALNEAYKTIEFLRGQINEVNLLNAKLLYTNRLFKDFAGVLDESYRMKIIENFDLTKNVREVKLAYALLAESLNFGTQTNQVKKATQKPVAGNKTQVKQITEGFASKPVSSTKPSQLITESNGMALRFKKLAGIKEPKN